MHRVLKIVRPASWIIVVLALTVCGEKTEDNTIDLNCYDVCETDVPPDEECYRSKRDPHSDHVALAVEIALRYVDYHPPEEMAWDWGEGTLMFSLTELYRVTGDTRFRDYYQAWMDHHIQQGYELTWSDSCPPAVTALALYQETGDETYRLVVEDVLHYLYHEALRTEEGGISHMGTLDIFGETLWLDSLFMFGMVLTRWGEHADDEQALDEIAEQFCIFKDLLQDPSGLMVHAYNWPLHQDPEVYWGRGNGWVTVSAHEYLRARRMGGRRDRCVEDLLDRQVLAILETQDPTTGLWWTVLNRPGETYLETSAAALFAYGLARGYRYGFRDDTVLPVVALALDGIQTRIEYDQDIRPVVTGISGPTTVGDFDAYARVTVDSDLSYGVAAVILALIEASGLPLPGN